MSRRITSLLSTIDRYLQDLWVFVPIWLQNIERRRALILRQGGHGLPLLEDSLED
jgi:hypothetical protein